MIVFCATLFDWARPRIFLNLVTAISFPLFFVFNRFFFVILAGWCCFIFFLLSNRAQTHSLMIIVLFFPVCPSSADSKLRATCFSIAHNKKVNEQNECEIVNYVF